MIFKKIVVLACLLVFGIQATAQPTPSIPNFTFYTYSNKPFTASQVAPSKQSFFIFFDPTCDHCQQAIAYINTNLQQFNKAAIYLVTLANAQQFSSFMVKYGPQLFKDKTVTFLQDVNNEFIAKFKPVKYPGMYLFNAQKKLLLYDDKNESLATFKKKISGK
jgi:thiol-disulfide isomerase/thioredoxin